MDTRQDSTGIAVATDGPICGKPRRPFAHLLTAERVARFWSRVDRSGGPDSCWLWTGNVLGEGRYGQLAAAGRKLLTHRVAWVLAHGEILGAGHVLHRCDMALCCNARHLFLGTQADNARDRTAKGRGRTGPDLTPEQVQNIRELAEIGVTYAAIGKIHRIAVSNVCKVVRRRTHRRVPDRVREVVAGARV